MRTPFARITLLLLLLGGFPAPAAAAPDNSPWERSLVSIEITRNQYDYVQPWSKRSENYFKNGVVIEGKRVLTTADQLSDHTLLRAQKGGRGEWFDARLEWVDYHANLALLEVKDAAFWKGLRPARLAPVLPTRGSVQVVRWRDGRFESRKAEVNRITVKRAKLSVIDHLHMDIDVDLKSAGWAEAVVAGNSVVGLTVSQETGMCTVLPSSLIKSVLDARAKNQFRGLGFFAFVWQRTENPAIHRFLKQTGEPQGVVVVEVPPIAGEGTGLQARDLILKVDGFDIDPQGDYLDPQYGKLMLENLATRNHWAGDEVPLRVLRDGQILDVKYRLPKVDYQVELVPQFIFDQAPEYLIVGGLVFQPLSEPYLRSWGNDWRRRVPFRMAHYERQKPTKDRPTLITLSLVLPDPYNMGYQDFRYLAVDTINGQKIRRMADVRSALEKPQDGFHVIEFDRGDSLRRLVLDASQAKSATDRVLKRYGIEEPYVILPEEANAADRR